MKIKKKENTKFKLTINQAQLNTLALVLGKSTQMELIESAKNRKIENITNEDVTFKLYQLLSKYMK